MMRSFDFAIQCCLVSYQVKFTSKVGYAVRTVHSRAIRYAQHTLLVLDNGDVVDSNTGIVLGNLFDYL